MEPMIRSSASVKSLDARSAVGGGAPVAGQGGNVASPPPYAAATSSLRTTQVTVVAGTDDASDARSRSVLKAEWPLPATATDPPA